MAESLTRMEAAALLGDRAPRVPWEEFSQYLDAEWATGESVSIFAPTNGGKTHIIRHGLLPHWRRYPVLWLKFKHRDRTLEGFGRQVDRYPTKLQRLRYEHRAHDDDHWRTDPEWFVVQLPRYRWTPDSKQASKAWHEARRIAGEAMDQSYTEGEWVLVVDEVLAFTASDQPALSLAAPLENIWQRGRDMPVTLIAATQKPAGAPSSMYDQARWVFLGRSGDVGRYQRLSELGGDTEVIRAILPTLGHQEFLAVDRQELRMWVVRAPEAGGAPGRSGPEG